MTHSFFHKACAVIPIALVLMTSAASAHATLANKTGVIGKTERITLKVPHGCGYEATHTVRIMIPDEADSALVQLSAWSYMEELQKVDIKVYRYTKGFMHHKVMVVDDEYATVGTANFDNRSFRLNFEITMAVADVGFTSKVATMLEHDMSNSRLVEKGELEKRGFFYRLGVRAARLMAPVQ